MTEYFTKFNNIFNVVILFARYIFIIMFTDF